MENKYDINEKRIRDEFIELTSIDSESLSERQMADALIMKLKEIGCTVEEDDAAEKIRGTSGNVFASFEGRGEGADAEPILFCAHMDTVVPGKGKEAFVGEDGIIKGNGKAVLGADDVTGIVEILEGLRVLKESGISHRPCEILFTVSEENFCRGINAFDISKLRSRDAYVFDLSGQVGKAATKAPSLIWFKAEVKGRSAHAGFDPENGINAIQTAARALARLPQGQIDPQTTFNIGRIEGGKVTNIVSDRCILTGEVRSYEHERAEKVLADMEEIFHEEAERTGAVMEIKKSVKINAYEVDRDSEVCRRFAKAMEDIGIGEEEGYFVSTFGGSDNNVLVPGGINGIVVTCGMYQAHSLKEYTRIWDLVKGAQLVAALCTV